MGSYLKYIDLYVITLRVDTHVNSFSFVLRRDPRSGYFKNFRRFLNMSLFTGAGVAIVTPMNADGSVN